MSDTVKRRWAQYLYDEDSSLPGRQEVVLASNFDALKARHDALLPLAQFGAWCVDESGGGEEVADIDGESLHERLVDLGLCEWSRDHGGEPKLVLTDKMTAALAALKGGRRMSEKRGWWNPRPFSGSSKFHYMVEGRSLCRRWLLLGNPGDALDDSNDDHHENCAPCRKRKLALDAKANGGGA